MSQNRRAMLIVSMRKMPAQNLARELNDILGNSVEINIHSYVEDGELTLSMMPRVFLASGENSYKETLKRYPKEKVIFAKRDIALPVFFERVFLLPKNKKVLVINETRDGTLDTIQNLVNIGVDYLEFKPYWQDCNLEVDSDIDTAISPGMLHICPPNIKAKIDIGMRQLSISIFIKILQDLDLDLSYTEKFLSYNKAVLVNAYKRLSEQYTHKEELRLSLESILDNINEAIISVENANIYECNPAAEKLLGFSKNEVLHKDINLVMGSDFWSSCVDGNETDDNVFLFNKKKLYVTYISFKTTSEKKGIFTFKETSEIEKLEVNVRKILYKKDSGYIAKYSFQDIIAKSESIKKLITTANSMAIFDSSILITGESGTGKELFAQSIHNASDRKNYPFVAVNFGAIPDNLVESELFGYEEGAFTGAKRSGKKGLFELAHNGTIFLDEIGNSSTWIQSRLLRVLEEKELMRLGDTKIIPINVRVIVATNKNLKELIGKGLFREDLYYRLNVFPLRIPPLRERKECIFPIITSFLSKNKINKTFSDEACECIMNYSWPGNIRELKNMVDYIIIQRNKTIVNLADLPYDMQTVVSESSMPIENDMELNLRQLESCFDLNLIRIMLFLFKRNTSLISKMGRNRMLAELASQGIILSDAKIRTIINHLEAYDLIEKGKTKQGTIISSKGELILNALDNRLRQ